MKYKSLNESILSVTNSQSKLVKEGLLGKLKKKVSRFGQAVGREMSDGDKSLKQELRSKREAPKGSKNPNDGMARRSAREDRKNEMKGPRRDGAYWWIKPGQTRRDDGRLRNSKGVLESKSGLVEEQKYIEEYIELLESALESIAEELECSVEELIEKADYSKVHYGLPIPKGRIDYLTRAEKAKGKLGGLKGKGKYRTSIADPKNKMGT